MKKILIMLAGGKGTRMKSSRNKILMPVCGKSIIARSVDAFTGLIDEMIIVSSPADQSMIREQLDLSAITVPVSFASGGCSRQESVRNGIMSLSHPDKEDIILIHDAARCLVDHELIGRVIRSAEEYGTGIPGIAATSTYKICDEHSFVISTPDRSSLFEIQTPQGFRAELIIEAHQKAFSDHIICTDDAGLLEYCGIPVRIVPGSAVNMKITYPEDMVKAAAILEGDQLPVRVGMGYDVHRLVAGRRLILCGVDIPYELGLLGHSDADVALHALMDAMLGACGLGDIGRHFPDTDQQWEGASSLYLLKTVNQMIRNKGFSVSNADITIVAQQPKLFPYVSEMVHNITVALEIAENRINVKATTTEHLGFEGRMEGISAYAVCTVSEGKQATVSDQ